MKEQKPLWCSVCRGCARQPRSCPPVGSAVLLSPLVGLGGSRGRSWPSSGPWHRDNPGMVRKCRYPILQKKDVVTVRADDFPSFTAVARAQPRNAVCCSGCSGAARGSALAACRRCTLGRCRWKGWGLGGALQVFPLTGESWKQISVFVFISLSKKGKGHLSS